VTVTHEVSVIAMRCSYVAERHKHAEGRGEQPMGGAVKGKKPPRKAGGKTCYAVVAESTILWGSRGWQSAGVGGGNSQVKCFGVGISNIGFAGTFEMYRCTIGGGF
jgi:hypothetical protein